MGLAVLACAPALAQTVSMGGSLGDKAVLIIDGTPRTVATGSTVHGVKLLGVTSNDATVEVAGKRQRLVLGGTQVNMGGAPGEGSGSRVVMSAGSGGHFVAGGSINGRSVRFLVDTGATYVALDAAEAERLGIDFRKGRRGISGTANGPIVVYQVSLTSVRIGDVQVYNVDAVVVQTPMDHVLLGNSFLTRFQMQRENETMTLIKRF